MREGEVLLEWVALTRVLVEGRLLVAARASTRVNTVHSLAYFPSGKWGSDGRI